MEGKTEEMILDSFTQLKQDWDSYGANPVSSLAINRAREVLNTLKNTTYHIAPLPDGGVQLEWNSENYYLEIEVAVNGDLGFYVRNKNR